jgi:hypothetical protein
LLIECAGSLSDVTHAIHQDRCGRVYRHAAKQQQLSRYADSPPNAGDRLLPSVGLGQEVDGAVWCGQKQRTCGEALGLRGAEATA